VGSVSTNVVVIDGAGGVITEIYTATRGRPIEVVGDALKQIDGEWGCVLNIRGVGTTGSGRELIGELIGADTINDEITAHKTGATFVGQTMLHGRLPDTIFEIGGQDSKYISVQDGIVVDFTMNDACAAGTGSFLEERAEELDIAIEGEFAELALSSKAPIRLGERCTVFMERDVNSYMQRGADKKDIVAGLAYSVVYNYINRVVRGRKIGDCVFFQGGTAYNDAVAAAFAAVTGKEIIVPPYNGVIGAIGAALLARDKMVYIAGRDAGGEDSSAGTYISDRNASEASPARASRSRFRGYDMSKIDYTLREFTCKGCSNRCQIQEFTVEGEKTYWGDKCSDKYRKRTKSAQTPVIEDLFAMREKMFLDGSSLPRVPADAPRVGIARAMFAMELLPFWRTFFAHCGFNVELSDPTNQRIVRAGLESVVAEPCFPIIVAHGHVADLIRRDLDYIFMPSIISMETKWATDKSYLCPWHQTLGLVCRRAPAFEPFSAKFLMPKLHFGDGRKVVGKELQRFFAKLGVGRRRVKRAVAAAFEAQDNFSASLLRAGKQALEELARTGQKGLVIMGRPYNVHDPLINLSVAGKLRKYYGVNCIPLDCLDTEAVDVSDINDSMYWTLGRRILAGAKIVGRHENLHIIYITNFKCGPDSFIRHFVRRASNKPFLSLQFDGHSNDAGMMTRCEAYLDSKGILRPWRKEGLGSPVAAVQHS
ncbi:MAG: CoA activase, partial [Planctomycetes bacterium]|nr:CoA activase [Planctomycetota bacterium]